MNGRIKNKLHIGLVLVIIGILLMAGVFAYYYIYQEEDKESEEEPEEFVLDNRISPYTNQGLFIEVLRIRNRGLMDKMLSFGTSWKNPPSFYYTLKVDEKESNVKGHLGSLGVFNDWDTFGQECLVPFDIEEEQESSDVTIAVVEEVKSGLFGRRTTDVVKEEIHLNYDYLTGRWTGDDYFKDKDGVGHYLGETYEVWFNLYQSDYDHDGIPFWIEANVLHTNPAVDDSVIQSYDDYDTDPDNDGIPTSWEWKWDYDPFVWNDHGELDPDVDGIENIEEYQMRKYLSNPYQPDIYIETDGMEKKGILDTEHIFYEEAQQMIMERYAQHGINVYIDDGEPTKWTDNGGGETLPFLIDADDCIKQTLRFYTHNFPDERKGIFRYIILGHLNGGHNHGLQYTTYDTCYIGNSIQARLLRMAFTQRVNIIMVAKNVLHEMGHTIGLVPVIFPGNDILGTDQINRRPSMSEEEYAKYAENYYSIMNYDYIYNKPFFMSEDRQYLFDYSDGSNGEPYDFDDWVHIFIPTFQLDATYYEEQRGFIDKSLEDLDVVDDYPGVILEGWDYDENLTMKLSSQLKDIATVKNTDYDLEIHVKTESVEDENNVRIYVKPNVEPVHAVWVLAAEGKLDTEEDNVQLYSEQEIISSLHELMD